MGQELGKDGKPILLFASQAEWEAWLDAEHAASDGVWVKFAKKGSGVETVVYAEALEFHAVRVDRQPGLRYDERFYLQKFTPRRSRSKWSRINREKIEELTGRGAHEACGPGAGGARQGRWAVEAAYASPANIEVPDDLEQALEASPKAAEFWAGLNKSNRYAVIYSSRTRRSRRRGRGGWRSSSRCSSGARSSTSPALVRRIESCGLAQGGAHVCGYRAGTGGPRGILG